MVLSRPFFTYMLQCADGSYYVGHTDDLEKRLAEHEEGRKCAYTETRRPVQLRWSQEFASRAEALVPLFVSPLTYSSRRGGERERLTHWKAGCQLSTLVR
jgi:hypothetical protein